MRIAVIGGGASGIAALKTLKEHGHDVTLFEQEASVGGVFLHKRYDDSRLVSSKYITAFSDFRLPAECEDHQTLEHYVDYLLAYCKHFQLQAHMQFNTKVMSLTKKGAKHLVCGDQEGTTRTLEFDAVAVCSGLHNIPFIPELRGQDSFRGEIIHSCDYKDSEQLKGRKVVVVGSGETAMDIAYRAVKASKSVTMAIRTGFLSVPTDQVYGQDVPLDTLITNLFECCYQHPWVDRYHLKWKVTTFFIRLTFLVGSGSSYGFNQHVGRLQEVKRGYHILNKSTRAMPYINKPLKEKSLHGSMYKWLDRWLDPDLDKHGHIDVVHGSVASLSADRVHFTDGSSVEADLLVLATGYRQRFPFLFPKDTGRDDPLPNEHLIVNTSDPTLAFLGFIRPNVGAIPPMAELQTMWWLRRLSGAIDGPCRDWVSYKLLGKNHRTEVYGVDYGAYMHDIARDIGAMPCLSHLMWRPRSFLAYTLGQAYVPFFRLEGPFMKDECKETADTELFRPVKLRGLGANFVFVLVCVVFGLLNLVVLMIDWATRPVQHILNRM